MYKRLLLATDLLEGSRKLALKALEITKHFHATLHLIHVIEAPLSSQYAQALGFAELGVPPIDEAKMVLNTLGEELNVTNDKQCVLSGSASTEIIKTADSWNIDAIIIGSHANSALANFLGSTANAIVHHAHCDVITLRMQNKD